MEARDVRERFWSKVDKKSSNECWEWQGSLYGIGYGRFRIGSRKFGAHRVSYALMAKIDVYDIPSNMCICHKCDNPSCVNPNHLFLGTFKDNVVDRDKKGRQARGEAVRRNVVSAEDVKQIRHLYEIKNISQSVLARTYKVSRGCIAGIVRRITWKHIST